MNLISGSISTSTTLGSIKKAGETAEETEHESDSTPVVIAASARRKDADTTVTTVVMTGSQGSQLPDMSLGDILEHTGVEQDATVLLQVESGATAGSNILGTSSTTDITGNSERLQNIVEEIENSDAVVIEVETSNDVQIVTVKATDIDSAYTNASASSPGSESADKSNMLLLKNGWAYTVLENSPLSLPLGPADEKPGEGWTLWRVIEGGGRELYDASMDTWNRISGQLVDMSPKDPADVSGIYQATEIINQTQSVQTVWDSLQLSSDGIFTSTRKTLATSLHPYADVSFISHSTQSARGRASSFSGHASSQGSSATVSYSGESLEELAGDMFGGFRILEDGMTLQLEFADGTVEQRLFLKTKSGTSVNNDGSKFTRTSDVSGDLLSLLFDQLTGGRKDALAALSEIIEKQNRDLATRGGKSSTRAADSHT